MVKISFITGNSNKFKEVLNLVKKFNINAEIERLDITPTEIQADSLEEVAKFKILSVIDKISNDVMIEDAGFFIKVLNGFPGVYSSYVMRVIGNEGIIKLMKDQTDRNAKFKAVIAYYSKKQKKNSLFLRRSRGKSCL